MRTTISLDDDVAAAVRRIQRERGVGVSEALNSLARAGLTVKPGRRSFRQQARRVGLRIDVTNIAETLEILDGPTAR